MVKKTTQVDVAIVGYGMAARMIGLLISGERRFDKVWAFDAPHPLNLGPDSLRNQSIIHYGIMYGEKNKVAAMRMAYSGRRMHEIVGLPIPEDGGIIRCRPEEVEKVFEVAKALQLHNTVSLVNDKVARKEIGPFFKSGFSHVHIPESLFQEGLIMTKADLLARENGLKIINAKVSLVPHPSDPTKCLIDKGDEFVEAEYLILCAGAGLPKLFDQLKLKHNIAVWCTPLIRFYSSVQMEASLFMDKSNGLSEGGFFVVQHKLATTPPLGYLVAAKSMRRPIRSDEPEQRVVLPDEEAAIRAEIPRSILPHPNAHGYRLVAGYKTEVIGQDGRSTIDSKIISCAPYKNVIAVVPGKATLTFDLAEQVLEWLHLASNVRPVLTLSAMVGGAVMMPDKPKVGKGSTDNQIDYQSNHQPVHMHHDPIYDGVLDERARTDAKPAEDNAGANS